MRIFWDPGGWAPRRPPWQSTSCQIKYLRRSTPPRDKGAIHPVPHFLVKQPSVLPSNEEKCHSTSTLAMPSSLQSSLGVVILPWLLYVFYSWYCLFRNYLIARKVGIPVRVIPINPENPLWMVVDKKIFIPIFEKLPFGSGSFTRFNWRGWEFSDKYRAHEEMGDVFMIATPGRNWIHLCNPEALAEVLRKEKDFPRPMEIFAMTKVFGDNLTTVCFNFLIF